MLDLILILAAAAVILFSVVAAMQPTDFRITRTGTINAPASAVFYHVNDLHQWDKMVGGQFEQGLAALKSVVEAGS